MKIPAKYLCLNVLIIAVAIISSTLFSLVQMRSEATAQARAMQESHINAFWELLREKGRDFRVAEGKLLAGTYVINGKYELPDRVREIFGGVATIFMGDVRVSTNVLMADGRRAVGTRLVGPAYDAIFRQGKPYRGEAPILGVSYFTAYDPIRNGTGEVIGALFVGVKKRDFFSVYDRLKVQQIVMSACLIVIFTLLTALLLRERKRAEIKLEKYNARLEELVAERTMELKTANEQLTREISGRNKILEAMRESESSLKALTESARDAILMMDPDGNVSFWNAAAERIFGYSAAEAVGAGLHELLAPTRYLDAYTSAFPEFRQNGSGPLVGKTFEMHALRKDGMEISVAISLSAVPLREGWYSIGILRDVTDKKRAEEELLRAKEAAEEANRLKGEFLANMSHEIRTPMNGVIGMTELLMDTELTGEQRDYVHTVKSSADSLMTIINDILDFSRIEARELDIESVNFALRDSLGDIMQTFALQAGEKGLELAHEVSSDVPDSVVGDPGRLRQIIVNLLGNAVKFTDRGKVILSVTREDGDEDGALLHFTVTDTGIGIPPEMRKKIFESFTQADASLTRRYGGTGLGLTISARLVVLLGGRIWVESEVGRGSVFHFTARLGLRKGSPVSRISGKTANPEGLHVLVVEDSAVNRRIAVGMLEKRGHAVVTAANGKEALAVLEAGGQRPFDLILMDVQMPEMDGIEATACIREKEKDTGRHLPIIALTAHAMREDREACIKAGMDGYVSKPLKANELIGAMDELIRPRPENGKELSLPGDKAAEAFDRERTLASVDGDMDLLREVVGMFLEDYPKTMVEIRDAIHGGDPHRLNRAAHALKGSVGNFGGRNAFDKALRLEMMGKDKELGGAEAVYSSLAEEVELLGKALEELAGGALCSRR